MLKRYEVTARTGLWLGFVLITASTTIAWLFHPLDPLFTTLLDGVIYILPCLALFTWGSSLYARAKGQSPWFGALALLGVLGLIGGVICILILALLPDHYKNNPDGIVDPGPPPPPYHPPAASEGEKRNSTVGVEESGLHQTTIVIHSPCGGNTP